MFFFNREDFFSIKNQMFVDDIYKLIDKFVINFKIKNNINIKDVSSLDMIRDSSILFVNKQPLLINEDTSRILIISDSNENFKNNFENIFIVKNLNETYNLILNNLFYHEDEVSYYDEFIFNNGSYLSKYSSIDKSCFIGKNCIIGKGVKIGKNSIIKNNVVIKNSIIGSNVVICDNTSIGTTGFGFDFKNRGSNNLNPQIGIVFIDDNCHIGSSCSIDRGKIDMTYIGKNSMIDNMVHIAHNVIIDDNACIAAQTGISGSVKIGVNVTIGGQVGFAGHVKVGDNVVIAAKSGVTKNVKDNSTIAGFPATDINLWKRKIINERKNRYK